MRCIEQYISYRDQVKIEVFEELIDKALESKKSPDQDVTTLAQEILNEGRETVVAKLEKKVHEITQTSQNDDPEGVKDVEDLFNAFKGNPRRIFWGEESTIKNYLKEAPNSSV